MTTTQTDEIKTWQQRLEETCPALGPMHIHACVEEVNDAMQAEINDLRVALQEQAREGEAVDSEFYSIPVEYQYAYPDGTWRCSNGDSVNGSRPTASRALYARKDGK